MYINLMEEISYTFEVILRFTRMLRPCRLSQSPWFFLINFLVVARIIERYTAREERGTSQTSHQLTGQLIF